MPYVFVVILGALLTGFALTNPATSQPPVFMVGDRETVTAIVDELNLPDDRRGLIHVILEDARVRAQREDGNKLVFASVAGTSEGTSGEDLTLGSLDDETRSELFEVLDHEQMNELHRAIKVVLAKSGTIPHK